MAENSDPDRPDNGDDANNPNPFAGTPMEDMFKSFSSGQMPDMNVLMAQMQRLFEPHEGSVNWELAKDVARQAVATNPDPSPTSAQQGAVADAMRLAEAWRDEVTDLPAGAQTPAAWSRAEWVEATMPTWRSLVEPIAQNVVGAMGEALPAEAKQMAGPLVGMLSQVGGAMFGH